MTENDSAWTPAEREAAQAFIDQMQAFTLNLVRLDPTTEQPMMLDGAGGGPIIASGFVISRDEKLSLVAARHTLGAGAWALETRAVFAREREVLLYKLGEPRTPSSGDVAWVPLDIAAMKHELLADKRMTGKLLDLPVYLGPLDMRPKPRTPYGFAASNIVSLVRCLDNPDIIRDGSYEVGMTYEGVESDGRYRFALSRRHKGHPYYGGASGAPIADSEGRIVSLVSAGDETAGVILGAPLADLIHEVTA